MDDIGGRKWTYPLVVVEKRRSFVASFPDVPEATIDGQTSEEAISRSRYILIAILGRHLDEGMAIPTPSPPDGRPCVTVSEADITRLLR